MINIENLFVLKSMKYNKNADTLLFLLLFITGIRKRNTAITLFVSAGAQKKLKNGSNPEFSCEV